MHFFSLRCVLYRLPQTLDNKVKVIGKYKAPGGKNKDIPEDKDDTDNDKIRTPEGAKTPKTDGITSMKGSTSPKTGDTTNIFIYILLLAAAAIVVGWIVKRYVKR